MPLSSSIAGRRSSRRTALARSTPTASARLPDEANQPPKRLAGFERVELEPGASERVTVTLDCTASNHPLSYFAPQDPNDL